MQTLHYTDVPAQGMAGLEGVTIRWVLSENVGAPNFAMRVIELAPGAATERHTHDWEHEAYILEGSGVVRDPAGVETPVVTGTCVYVPPNELHQFAAGADGMRFICVIPNPKKG